MLKLAIFGIIIGVANIIPGVSGGTMAVVLGVYDKLIGAISNIRTDFKNSLKLLIPIGIGALVGIALFAKLIEYTLANFPMATNFVFIGLIIGSIPLIFKSATKEKFSLSSTIAFVLMFGVMLAMLVITPDEGGGKAITTLTVFTFLQIFLSSVIAAATMIIPGISGSFVLLLLGMYTTILTAISDFNFLILVPVGLGVIVGILGCAKLIEKMFEYAPSQTYSAILGLMLGSILVIFPSIVMGAELIISIILCAGAAVTAYLFSKK